MSLQRNAGGVRRFARAMKFGAWLQALPQKLTPPPFRLLQIDTAFWQSRALYVAARLDLAGALGDEQLSAAELAGRVGADADALDRLLRLLVAIGVFAETPAQTYANNPVSACLRAEHPQSVRAMILMHHSPAMSRPWFEQLENGVRAGVPPFALCHGESLFDYLDHRPDEDRLFAAAMDSVEALAGDGFARDVDWGRFTRLIDIGGSRGAKALSILQRHPGLQAVVVDRPAVIAAARAWCAGQRPAGCERLHYQAGDLFGDDLPEPLGAGDIYLLAAVLHAFEDERALAALRNLHRLIGSSGARIAILELVLPERGVDVAAAAFDLQMFMGTRGRERSLSAWSALVAAAGLCLDEVVGLRGLGSVLVLRRAA